MKTIIKKSIILFFLIVLYALAVYIFPKINIFNHEKSNDYERTVVKTKPNESVPQPSELFENLQLLTENRPALLHVRNAFNSYLAGVNEGIAQEAIKSRVIEGSNFGLESFSKDYYSSKFMVFEIQNPDDGYNVSILHIIFIDKPDKLFGVLVKKEQHDEYLFLGIHQLSAEFDKEKAEEFKKIFQERSEEVNIGIF